ncbi:hypothetical protein Tco_1295339 [Tanacetum coccineum]
MAMTSVHISSGLVLHQMTSDHNRSELGIHDHSNEPSSSKLVPKVVPLAVKTATSRQELELLFHHHIAMLRTTDSQVCIATLKRHHGISDAMPNLPPFGFFSTETFVSFVTEIHTNIPSKHLFEIISLQAVKQEVLRNILVILPENITSDTISIHNEDGNPA